MPFFLLVDVTDEKIVGGSVCTGGGIGERLFVFGTSPIVFHLKFQGCGGRHSWDDFRVIAQRLFLLIMRWIKHRHLPLPN